MNKSQRPGIEEWRQIIDGQRPSGLTVAAYSISVLGLAPAALLSRRRRHPV